MLELTDFWIVPGLYFLAEWSLRWGLVLLVLAVWFALRAAATGGDPPPVVFGGAGDGAPASGHASLAGRDRTRGRRSRPQSSQHRSLLHRLPTRPGLSSRSSPRDRDARLPAVGTRAWRGETPEPARDGTARCLAARRDRDRRHLGVERPCSLGPAGGRSPPAGQAQGSRIALRRELRTAPRRVPASLGASRPTSLGGAPGGCLAGGDRRPACRWFSSRPTGTTGPRPTAATACCTSCAHLARRDDWAKLVQELVRVPFFFHPLVRWLLKRLDRERELLCDEAVVALGADPVGYARLLLDLARRPGRLLLSRGGTTARLAPLLRPRHRRGPHRATPGGRHDAHRFHPRQFAACSRWEPWPSPRPWESAACKSGPSNPRRSRRTHRTARRLGPNPSLPTSRRPARLRA